MMRTPSLASAAVGHGAVAADADDGVQLVLGKGGQHLGRDVSMMGMPSGVLTTANAGVGIVLVPRMVPPR